MLKKYKNAILKTIEDSGLDPTSFISKPGAKRFKIEYSGTSMWFTIFEDLNSYHRFRFSYNRFSPSSDIISSDKLGVPSEDYNIKQVLAFVLEWIPYSGLKTNKSIVVDSYA